MPVVAKRYAAPLSGLGHSPGSRECRDLPTENIDELLEERRVIIPAPDGAEFERAAIGSHEAQRKPRARPNMIGRCSDAVAAGHMSI